MDLETGKQQEWEPGLKKDVIKLERTALVDFLMQDFQKQDVRTAFVQIKEKGYGMRVGMAGWACKKFVTHRVTAHGSERAIAALHLLDNKGHLLNIISTAVKPHEELLAHWYRLKGEPDATLPRHTFSPPGSQPGKRRGHGFKTRRSTSARSECSYEQDSAEQRATETSADALRKLSLSSSSGELTGDVDRNSNVLQWVLETSQPQVAQGPVPSRAQSPHAPSASPNIFGTGIDLFAHPNDAPAACSVTRQSSIGALSRAFSQEGTLPTIAELNAAIEHHEDDCAPLRPTNSTEHSVIQGVKLLVDTWEQSQGSDHLQLEARHLADYKMEDPGSPISRIRRAVQSYAAMPDGRESSRGDGSSAGGNLLGRKLALMLEPPDSDMSTLHQQELLPGKDFEACPYMRHSWDARPYPEPNPSQPPCPDAQPSSPPPFELGLQHTGISVTNLPPIWARKTWTLSSKAGGVDAQDPTPTSVGDLRQTGLSVMNAPNRHAWDLESLFGGSGSVDSSEGLGLGKGPGQGQGRSSISAHRPARQRASSPQLDHRWMPLFPTEASLERYLDHPAPQQAQAPPQNGHYVGATNLSGGGAGSAGGARQGDAGGEFAPKFEDLARLLTLYGKRPAGVGRKDIALFEPSAPPPPAMKLGIQRPSPPPRHARPPTSPRFQAPQHEPPAPPTWDQHYRPGALLGSAARGAGSSSGSAANWSWAPRADASRYWARTGT